MPTYDYSCKTCGAVFEVLQPMNNAPLTTCTVETCKGDQPGAGHVERMISGGSGVIYRGGGFYLTDYVRKSGGDGGSSSSASGSVE
jgi:putative FmdB family regulatory protein